jgi:GH24 family phage-related lysozyme (muramidase)
MSSSIATRISNIQKKISIAESGIFDMHTCKAIEKLKGVKPTENSVLIDRKKAIQKSFGFQGKEIDGIIGPITLSRIEQYLSTYMPPIPKGASMIVSKKSLDLIINSEVSSFSAYNTKYKFPVLPGEDSGITIGIGYDLGHVSASKLDEDWGMLLSTSAMNKLHKAVGKKNTAAKAVFTAEIKAVEISWEKAIEVFYTKSMPKYAKDTLGIYDGVQLLPPDAQGALVSLVYNRGTSFTKPSEERRKEMKNIAKHVLNKDLEKIAAEIVSMKRLWDINTSKGLHIRRDNEAALVKNATYFILPNEYIFL